VQSCLEYTNDTLELTTISLPAISSGLFSVSKINVAEAMCKALQKCDESKPDKVQEVNIVNIDDATTIS